MKNSKKGFTLVEIIVVLVIMGILLAIAIPSILGYVEKANDAKLLAQARNVLVSSKGLSVEYYADGTLSEFPSSKTVKETIMKDANIEGTLISIKLNSQKDSSGDFVVKIENKYISYNDKKQEFTIYDKNPELPLSDTINNELVTDSKMLSIITDYFAKDRNRKTLDSEGPNFGKELKDLLKAKGYDTDNLSFRVYRTDKKVAISVSEKKITSDMIGTTIDIVQFDYGNDQTFKTTPDVYTGAAKVTQKKDDKSDVTYPVMDLTGFDDTKKPRE